MSTITLPATVERLRTAFLDLERTACRVAPSVGTELRDMTWSLDRAVAWDVPAVSPLGRERAALIASRARLIADRADGMTYHAEPVSRRARELAALAEA